MDRPNPAASTDTLSFSESRSSENADDRGGPAANVAVATALEAGASDPVPPDDLPVTPRLDGVASLPADVQQLFGLLALEGEALRTKVMGTVKPGTSGDRRGALDRKHLPLAQ